MGISIIGYRLPIVNLAVFAAFRIVPRDMIGGRALNEGGFGWFSDLTAKTVTICCRNLSYGAIELALSSGSTGPDGCAKRCLSRPYC
jgi:hypothetical protein